MFRKYSLIAKLVRDGCSFQREHISSGSRYQSTSSRIHREDTRPQQRDRYNEKCSHGLSMNEAGLVSKQYGLVVSHNQVCHELSFRSEVGHAHAFASTHQMPRPQSATCEQVHIILSPIGYTHHARLTHQATIIPAVSHFSFHHGIRSSHFPCPKNDSMAHVIFTSLVYK